MHTERHVLIWAAAAVVAILAFGLLRDALLPFVLGLLLAYALNPLVELILRTGLPRVLVSAVVLIFGLALIALVVALVAPPVVDQLQRLALDLPGQLQKLRTAVEEMARARLGARYAEVEGGLRSAVDGIAGNWAAIANVAANTLLAQVKSVVNLVSVLLVAPLVAFYVLVDWHPMMAKIDGWLPRDQAPTIRRLAGDINGAISAFVRGQGLVCLILAAFYGTALQVIGLQYGLLVGLATGIASFVPFVGWALGLITALALALAQYWPATNPVLIVAAVFVVGYVLDAAVLSPAIVGSRIGLHPVWLLFALIAFSSLFGFVGVLVAVPVAAAVAVLVRFGLEVYLGSALYKGRTSP
jgi:predicted PurR-regulated permease PerM